MSPISTPKHHDAGNTSTLDPEKRSSTLAHAHPMVVHRHYVRNYFDLVEYIFSVFLTAGNIDSDIIIAPGQTVGEAFNVTEADIGAALAGDAEHPSIFIDLIANMMRDSGFRPAVVSMIIPWLAEYILGKAGRLTYLTFAEKADALKTHLDGMVTTNFITPSQAHEVLGAFRSIGKLVCDLLAYVFPNLTHTFVLEENERKRKTLEFDSSYEARVSGNPSEVLHVNFLTDVIEVTIHVKQFVIGDDASIKISKLNKKKNEEKEKDELVTGNAAGLFGPVSFNGVTLRLQLHDGINASPDYPWALGSPVHHAVYNTPTVDLKVDSVNIQLVVPELLVGFFEGLWKYGMPFLPSPKLTAELEQAIANLIVTTINSGAKVSAMVSQFGNYVTPITEVLLTDAYGLAQPGYRDIWAEADARREVIFGRFDARFGNHFASIENVPKDDPVGHPADDPPELKFPDEEDRDTVLSHKTARKHQTGKLGVGQLHPDGLVEESVATDSRETRDDLNQDLPFDEGVWKVECDASSPIDLSVGRASDPSWIGLSSNCVAATELFRALKSNDRLPHKGSVQSEGRSVSYKVNSCSDIAADFTGRSFFGAPALVVRRLQVTTTFGESSHTMRPAPLPVVAQTGGPKTGGSGAGHPQTGHPDVFIPDGDDAAEFDFRVDARIRLKATLPDVGCLPSEAVPYVAHNLGCIAAMCNGTFTEHVRSTHIEQRHFVYLSPDLDYDPDGPHGVPTLEVLKTDGPVLTGVDRAAIIREIVREWVLNLPAVPIFHNSFYGVEAKVMRSKCQGGWIAVYAHYPFPEFL